jgi:hypothetical protein
MPGCGWPKFYNGWGWRSASLSLPLGSRASFAAFRCPRTALNIVRTARATTGAPDFAGAQRQAVTKSAGLCDLSHGIFPGNSLNDRFDGVSDHISREDRMSRLCRTAVAALTFAMIGVVGLALGTSTIVAADLAIVPRPSRIQHPSAPASSVMRLEEFAKGPNASCTAWTDGCRSCGSSPDGVFCSNVGIACQPSEPRCTRR